MADQFAGQVISAISSGNLSAQQFRPMKVGSADGTVVAQSSAGGEVIGILQNTPSTGGGDGAAVMVSGVSKMSVTSTKSTGIARLAPLVASSNGGVKASTGNVAHFVLGRALTAISSATTGLITGLITLEGFGSTQ